MLRAQARSACGARRCTCGTAQRFAGCAGRRPRAWAGLEAGRPGGQLKGLGQGLAQAQQPAPELRGKRMSSSQQAGQAAQLGRAAWLGRATALRRAGRSSCWHR